MKYIPQPPVFTDLTDYFTVDATNATVGLVEDRHMEYLVKAVDVLYEQWEEDLGLEGVADARMVRALGEVLESTCKTPQVSQMRDYTNNF